MDTIDAQHSGLLAMLYASVVIDNLDKDYLESGSSSSLRNEMLLSMLGRKSEEQFELFLDGLSATGQEHIVYTLRGDKDSPDETGNDVIIKWMFLYNTNSNYYSLQVLQP